MKNQSVAVRLLLGSLGVIAAVMPSMAAAQTTYTWTGGGSDNNWSTAGNWSGGVPASSGNSVLSFSGSTRTSSDNNLGDWNLSIGRLQFDSAAASFTLGGNTFGFDPYLGSQTQQIFQNSANTQTIGVAAFSFRNGADSQINLNAGDLVISSPDLFIDSSNSATRSLTVTGADSTRRTVTFAGDVNKGGNDNDPDMYIQSNKRALVTGSLTFGSGNDGSVFIDDGVLQFSGTGTMTGGRPVIGATSGSANAAVWLDTPAATFGQQLELRNGSSGRRTIGGLNTSGTTTFSGEFVGNAGEYDLAAATGGTVTFSGPRSVDATLHVNRPDGSTAYGGSVVLSDGTTAVNKGFNIYGGVLEFGDFAGVMGDGTNFIEFSATAGNSGTFRYTGGSFTTTRRLWIDNSGITRAAIDISQSATTLTWNPSDGTRSQNLTKTGSGTLVFGGGITGGDVAIEAGTLILTGANSFSGGTVVSGGTLEVSAGGSQGGSPSALGTGAVSIAAGGRVAYWLSLSDPNTVANAFSLSGGTLHTTDGFNTYSGLVTLASGESTVSAQYEDTITLSGGLAGSGNVLFTQSGGTGPYNAPTYVLSGTGANTGTVRADGTSNGSPTKLQLASVNALQSATLDLATADVGVVEFTVAGTNTYTLGGLQGSRNLAAGANSLSVGGNNQTTTYSGGLTAGSLTKTGSGELTLAGSNLLSGSADVSAGQLSVDGSLTTSLVTVFTAAGLGGSGSITGPVNIASGGTLSPGNSIASLSAGATTLAGSSIFEYEYDSTTPGSLAAAADLFVVNGNLTIDSGALITFADLAVSPNPFVNNTTTFALINYSGTWNGGLFTLGSTVLTDGSRFLVGGQEWEIDYNRTSSTGLANFTADYLPSSSFVAITAVPEPTAYAMALAGLACGGYSMWRRRKRHAVRSAALLASQPMEATSWSIHRPICQESRRLMVCCVAAVAVTVAAPAWAQTSWNAYDDFYFSPTAAGWGGATSPSATGAAWGQYMGNVNGTGGFPNSIGTYLSTSQLYRFSSVNPLGVSGPVYSQSYWDNTGGAGFARYVDNVEWNGPGVPVPHSSLGSYSTPWFVGAPGLGNGPGGSNLTNLIWMQSAYLSATLPSPSGEGIASVLTWTAPATQVYDFYGLFVSGDASTLSAAVAITDSLGGTAPLSRTVLANNSVQSFSFSKAYTAGDVVQFQVGNNLSSGNVVGLQVSIVPEPSTLLLLGTGLFGLLASARRKRA